MKADRERHLWNAFRKGDKAAFKAVYEEFAPGLLHYGSRITPDEALVEDSVQDLFVELWNSGERLSETTSVKFYLFKALRFKIRRNMSKSHGRDLTDIDTFMTILKTPSFEDDLIRSEARAYQLDNLKTSIETLPDRQREAINLRFYHNFSNEEISRIMGVNYHSACKFIYAALKQLKEKLKVAVAVTSLLIVLFAL